MNELPLLERVTESIEKLIETKKLKYIEETDEFVQGLLIGLEIAGMYGDEIKQIYSDNTDNPDTD